MQPIVVGNAYQITVFCCVNSTTFSKYALWNGQAVGFMVNDATCITQHMLAPCQTLCNIAVPRFCQTRPQVLLLAEQLLGLAQSFQRGVPAYILMSRCCAHTVNSEC